MKKGTKYPLHKDLYAPDKPKAEVLAWPDIRRYLSNGIMLPQTVQLDLLRHGETTTNAQCLVKGSQNVLLTSTGETQARRIGSKLASHYELAIHSTLERSARTLRLAVEHGYTTVDQVYSDYRLNERSLGVLELCPSVHLEEYRHGDLHFAPPGGDSYAEVARRCLSLLLDLAVFVHHTHPQKILLSGHMGPMRILVGILEEQSDAASVLNRSFKNTELVRVKWQRVIIPKFLEHLSFFHQ